jgi:hypothetical protein
MAAASFAGYQQQWSNISNSSSDASEFTHAISLDRIDVHMPNGDRVSIGLAMERATVHDMLDVLEDVYRRTLKCQWFDIQTSNPPVQWQPMICTARLRNYVTRRNDTYLVYLREHPRPAAAATTEANDSAAALDFDSPCCALL